MVNEKHEWKNWVISSSFLFHFFLPRINISRFEGAGISIFHRGKQIVYIVNEHLFSSVFFLWQESSLYDIETGIKFWAAIGIFWR